LLLGIRKPGSAKNVINHSNGEAEKVYRELRRKGSSVRMGLNGGRVHHRKRSGNAVRHKTVQKEFLLFAVGNFHRHFLRDLFAGAAAHKKKTSSSADVEPPGGRLPRQTSQLIADLSSCEKFVNSSEMDQCLGAARAWSDLRRGNRSDSRLQLCVTRAAFLWMGSGVVRGLLCHRILLSS
jgi:hypothetical protein